LGIVPTLENSALKGQLANSHSFAPSVRLLLHALTGGNFTKFENKIL